MWLMLQQEEPDGGSGSTHWRCIQGQPKARLASEDNVQDLVRLMVDADMVSAKQEAHLNNYNNSDVQGPERL